MVDQVRLLGGPYDGAGIDAVKLFGSELPASLSMPSGPAHARRHAIYELDIDALGECYRHLRSEALPRFAAHLYVSRN